MDSDVEESLRKRPRKNPFSVDSSSRKQLEQYSGRPFTIMGEVNFTQDDDNRLEITRNKFGSLLKRHGDLTERLASHQWKLEEAMINEGMKSTAPGMATLGEAAAVTSSQISRADIQNSESNYADIQNLESNNAVLSEADECEATN
ncbi:hypothetical protein VNO78_01014 [Psophocarpus tetragonolobus]|uniref:Uncharacterized protein n=1 Tax=Psophocarpus tetragonolobus TaxID=3891 RepID=A0AAN9TA00_PSOTE